MNYECLVEMIYNDDYHIYIVLNNNYKLLKRIDVNELSKVVSKSTIERICF